jgi:hypothetical protein
MGEVCKLEGSAGKDSLRNHLEKSLKYFVSILCECEIEFLPTEALLRSHISVPSVS